MRKKLWVDSDPKAYLTMVRLGYHPIKMLQYCTRDDGLNVDGYEIGISIPAADLPTLQMILTEENIFWEMV